MPNYIWLGDKRYMTSSRTFQPVRHKSQRVRVGLSSKTIAQTFSFVDQRWTGTILVWVYPTDPLMGSRDDLIAAYESDYINFVDLFNVNQGDVFIEGDLPEALRYFLVDDTVPFEVSLSLRKRQV